MSHKRRLVIIIYTLAVAIFLLSSTGDGENLIRYITGYDTAYIESARSQVISKHTERTILEGTSYETLLYIVESPLEGPVIMVIGGIHGNEPAGYMAAESISSWAIDRGMLLVISRANVPAIKEGVRTVDGYRDLNRSFPGDWDGEKSDLIAAAIVAIMDEFRPDWVVDLHEALSCERHQPGMLGQSFIYPCEAESLDIVYTLLTSINHTIYDEEDHFLLLRGMAGGSAIEAGLALGSDVIIIETCMQMPINERVRYHRQVVSSLLYILGVNVY